MSTHDKPWRSRTTTGGIDRTVHRALTHRGAVEWPEDDL